MALIEITRGPNVGQRYDLEDQRIVLGRHPDCDIVLEVAAVSRQHAKISRDGSRFFIEDLGSRNGTLVNGEVIQGRTQLGEGDAVKICDLDFLFHQEEPGRGLNNSGLAGEDSSIALLFEDDAKVEKSTSTVMSTFDVSSSRTGTFLSARPEIKLSAMIEISRNLGQALALEEVLPKLLDSLFKIFVQADRGFVVMQDREDGPLVPKAVKHRRPGEEEQIRISRTIINKAMTSKEAILSADATSDERFDMAQSIADFHIRSMMCAPLVTSEGEALGVIQIDTMDQRSRFNGDDLEVLVGVANQAAVVIENAQMHERSLRQRALERDLELARQVQRGLLPSEPPKVSNYRFFDFYDSAYQVGGDYYDYVPLSGGRMAVVLGDVSGKGVAAALLMAKLSGDVRFCLASESEPTEAVNRINTTFANNGWEDRFVTFVVAILDPESGELTVINAGHMPPMLRHSGMEVEEIGEELAGLPLGVLDDFEYESYTTTLEPGDFLVLFTDGISEAMNSEGDMYGLERIRQQLATPAVGVDELGQHLLEDVRRYVGGHPQSDDMCIACFGRLED